MVLQKKIQLDKEYIFSKISSWDVFSMYIPGVKPKETICSPIRKDRNPSWALFHGNQEWVYRDFATGECGSCIDLVKQMYNLSYLQAIKKIAQDFMLTEGNNEYKRVIAEYKEPVDSHKSLIQVTTRYWEKRDIEWWKKFNIGQQALKEEKVHPVKELYLNRKRIPIGLTEKVYAYEYPEGFKIYMPERKKGEKWLCSISTRIIENLQDTDKYDKIVISKSKKDRLTLQSILPEIGIVNLQNEGITNLSEEFISSLKGKKVWISLDSDPPGIAASHKINDRYKWMMHVNVPYEYKPAKDWSDMCSEYGSEMIREHFKKKGII